MVDPMTIGQWEKIREIFESAVELNPDARDAFLDDACDGDERVRAEIESLLDAHKSAQSFMEVPAPDLFAALFPMPHDETLTGQQTDRYKILERLGRGGWGQVYLAKDTKLNRPVALKFIHPWLASNEQCLRRLKNEALAVAAINHPNIVSIIDFMHDGDKYYIVMEYLEGHTLRQRIRSSPMKVGEALEVCEGVCAALAEAHTRGIVHRDIKPENIILLGASPYVKVLDFGIAKVIGVPVHHAIDQWDGFDGKTVGALTNHDTQLLGTFDYMSPEQSNKLPIDDRTDLWSLGVVLYEMLTQHRPFEASTEDEVRNSITQKEPAPLSTYFKEAPDDLQRIVNRALAKKREDRYQNAGEFRNDLVKLKGKLPDRNEEKNATLPALGPFSHDKPGRRPATLSGRYLMLAAVVVAVLSAAALIALRNQRTQSSDSRNPSLEASPISDQRDRIIVDGDPADWMGITPLLTGEVGNAPLDASGKYYPGSDFVNIFVANDTQNVYFLMEFAGDPFSGGIALFLNTDLSPATGCGGNDYIIFVSGSATGEQLAIGDYRSCEYRNDYSLGAIRSATADKFVEAAISIETLRILSPAMSAMRVSAKAISPPPSATPDVVGPPALYSLR